jgi:hypothetical protein
MAECISCGECVAQRCLKCGETVCSWFEVEQSYRHRNCGGECVITDEARDDMRADLADLRLQIAKRRENGYRAAG